MKDLIKFLFSKQFWKHLFIIVLLGSIIIIVILTGLKTYTRHGNTFAVPDLKGLTVSEAVMVAASKNLRIQITDSIYISDEARGSVVDQNPGPQFRVKENRTIFLTINAMNPERIPMPDVIGVSLRQARAILETHGLDVGRLIYVPDIALNNVLEQRYQNMSIEPGELVVKGEGIDLVLGEGLSSRRALIPNLLYISKEEARVKILESSLNLGATLYDSSVKTGEDSLNAFVWRQRPEYSKDYEMPMGSLIDLFLTIDSTYFPKPDSTELFIPLFDEDDIIIL